MFLRNETFFLPKTPLGTEKKLTLPQNNFKNFNSVEL